MPFDPSTAKLFDEGSAKLVEDEEELSTLDKLKGAGEVALSLATGAVGGGLGTLSGTIAGLRQYGLSNQKAVEQEAARQAEALTYVPRTRAGQEMMEPVGEFVGRYIIPMAPHMADLEGAALASKFNKRVKQAQRPTLAESQAPVVPQRQPNLSDILMEADKAPENQRMGPVGKTTFDPTSAKLVEEAPVQAQRRPGSGRQLDLGLEIQQPLIDPKTGEAAGGYSPREPRPGTIQVSPSGTAMVSPDQVAGYEQFGRRMETPEAPPQAPLRGQGDLFLNEEVTGPIASPFNAAERGALPPLMTENPALARRQMDLGFEIEQPLLNKQGEPIGGYAPPELRPGTIFADEAGTITRELPEQGRIISEDYATVEFARREAEAKAREIQAKAAVERGETGELFGDYVNKHRDYELFRDESGRPLNKTDFTKTVDNLAKDSSTGYIRPEDMDAAYQKYLDNFGGVQAGLFDQPTQAKGMQETLKADAAERMSNDHPLVKAAEKFVAQEQQFLDQLKQQGASLDSIKQAADDVLRATERLEATRANVLKSIRSTGSARNVQPLRKSGLKGKKQGGGVTTDFLSSVLSLGLDRKIGNLSKKVVDISRNESKNKFMPKVGLEDYTFERRSAAEVADEALRMNIPDMPSSMLDNVQAGGLFKQLETNNPIVRKVFFEVKDASHRATRNIRSAIQDPDNGLPALFRSLTKNEAGDWWAARQVAEGEMDLTPQQMREMGMSEKQIRMNERFNEVTDYVFNKVNEMRAAAGKAPIDKRVGYLAGQASGDFRRLIYKRGENGAKEVIGIVGSNFKHSTEKQVRQILKDHPEWEAGELKVSQKGRRESRQKAFEDAVEMLAENNPDTKALLDAYDNILKQDAYNYMNAKKHTMQKKGVFGTEGFKRNVTAWTNAKEGMSSQIRYIEKMLNWVEMSKAVDEVKPLLTDDRLNMPNAKRWADDYLDRALGIQNSEVGAALDGLLGAVGKQFGVGPTAIERGAGMAKAISTKKLLGFGNPAFLAMQILQPMAVSPVLTSLLKSRNVDATLGMMSKGAFAYSDIFLNRKNPSKLSRFDQEILSEGNNRNIFGSEIFEHHAALTKVGKGAQVISELGIPSTEAATRGTVFTAVSKVLKENGYSGTKLFDIAENLTNQFMVDYSHIEAPAMYKKLGAVGDMAVSLQRYKHSGLSSLAMLAREAKRNRNARPLMAAITTQIAMGGLTGTLLFNEADWLYQKVTGLMGQPDTLTRVVLDNTPEILSHGAISAMSRMDMSKRFGMTLLPENFTGAFLPGTASLLDPILSGGKALIEMDNATQWERFAKDVVPAGAKRGVERLFFEDEEGLAINPNKLEGTVRRNTADKVGGYIGATGIHESKQKSRLYQETLVDKAIAEKRTSVTNKIFDDLYQLPKEEGAIAEYFESERGQELRDKFLEAEGNIDNLISAVVKFQTGKQTTALQRKMLQAAAAQKEGDLKKAQRYMKLKESLDE